MTLEELKQEANRLGYRLRKKDEYVPMRKCRCGQKPRIWHVIGSGKIHVACSECDITTSLHDTKIEARREWNKIIGGN